MPTKPPEGLKMPVVVWGNGACHAKGTMFINMLIEWASHGIMVIANGEPNGSGSETAQWDTEAINWALRNAGKGKYTQVTASRIGVAGQSCGGLEAYTASRHANVTAIGIFNSGALNASQKPIAKGFKKPVAYFLGGSSDIAYRQVRLQS
jgi:dienelactone hydrolase